MKTSGSPAYATYLGAPSSTYTFPEYTSGIPLCQRILDYFIIDIVPSGKLQYPSAACMTLPCNSIDVDVTVAPLDIDFKIFVTTQLPVIPSSADETMFIQIT